MYAVIIQAAKYHWLYKWPLSVWVLLELRDCAFLWDYVDQDQWSKIIRSWYIKGTCESTQVKDLLSPLMHYAAFIQFYSWSGSSQRKAPEEFLITLYSDWRACESSSFLQTPEGWGRVLNRAGAHSHSLFRLSLPFLSQVSQAHFIIVEILLLSAACKYLSHTSSGAADSLHL